MTSVRPKALMAGMGSRPTEGKHSRAAGHCRTARRLALAGASEGAPAVRSTVLLGSARSLNDLVRAEEQRLGDREAERLRGVEIEHELKLRRLLHRQLAWPRALENPVDIAGRPAQLIVDIHAIGDQAAASREIAAVADRREALFQR